MNREDSEHSREQFGELLKYTLAGYIVGLLAGVVLDASGRQSSAMGQWLVRTFSGEGESIFEGIYAFRARLGNRTASMAETYGWGKFLGMLAPWVIDWLSRLAGVDVYGIQSFYIPYFYAMSDQIGASISGFVYLRRETGSVLGASEQYLRHPVMVASLLVILIVPIGLFAARLIGFSPTSQALTAVETIAANLCWVPPLVGWVRERRGRA